jgi:hypothetical protein
MARAAAISNPAKLQARQGCGEVISDSEACKRLEAPRGLLRQFEIQPDIEPEPSN